MPDLQRNIITFNLKNYLLENLVHNKKCKSENKYYSRHFITTVY